MSPHAIYLRDNQLIGRPRNWSYLFYVLAGLGAVPLVLGYFAMPWDRRAFRGSKVPRIDWVGGFLVVSGLSLFMFSLTQSGVIERGWSEPCTSMSLDLRTFPDTSFPPKRHDPSSNLMLIDRRANRVRPLYRATSSIHVLGTTSRK